MSICNFGYFPFLFWERDLSSDCSNSCSLLSHYFSLTIKLRYSKSWRRQGCKVFYCVFKDRLAIPWPSFRPDYPLCLVYISVVLFILCTLTMSYPLFCQVFNPKLWVTTNIGNSLIRHKILPMNSYTAIKCRCPKRQQRSPSSRSVTKGKSPH